MSKEPEAPQPAAPAPKKSRRGLFIILTVVVILLLGGGGGAYWFFFRDPGTAQAKEKEPEKPEPTGVIALEPFVVNLADPSGSRFLRVTLSLVVADEAAAKEFEENKVAHMRVRSAILELLAQKQSSELTTPEGKEALKKAIAKGVARADKEIKVDDVLFSEFIVQF